MRTQLPRLLGWRIVLALGLLLVSGIAGTAKLEKKAKYQNRKPGHNASRGELPPFLKQWSCHRVWSQDRASSDAQ